MGALKLVFWICVLVPVYVFVGYPVLLWTIRHFYRRPVQRSNSYQPTVSITIAAYNEESNIRRAIQSALGQDYPKDKLEIIVGSDGSTDCTAEIVKSFSTQGVRLLDLPRSGKASTDNALIAAAHGDIVISTSAFAHAEPSWVRTIVSNFADPEVGCVTGADRMVNREVSSTSRSEVTYWSYEWWLRTLESDLGILCVSNGACLAFRRSLYQPIPPSSDVDNMVPLLVIQQGYRVIHDVDAWVYEEAISSPAEQLRNRTRQVSKSMWDILRMSRLLNPLRYPGVAFSLWSHRLLRWSTPLFLCGVFLSCTALAIPYFTYRVLLAVQLAFYLVACFLLFAGHHLTLPRWLSLPASFLMVNIAMARGLVNVIRGHEISMWRDESGS